MEWKDEFNSFNSWKGLAYLPQYEAIAREFFLPPIEASLDPIEKCQLKCKHCNAGRYLGKNRMEDEHLIKLIEFLGIWGVRAICFGGGGEPSLHTKLGDAIKKTVQGGMKASVATNGIIMRFDAYKLCRWIGVSLDAATSKTYRIGRKGDYFKRVIANLEKLCLIAQKDCAVAYKFLIFDYNQHEIYEACKLAKNLGVRDFHARPADLKHQGMIKQQKNAYAIEKINEQFEKCHALENKNFRVFTVTHKFNSDFTPKRKFSQCYASPICIQLCADGNIYLCPDTRHKDEFIIGRHIDNNGVRQAWGNKRHKELVYKNGADMCSSRCTFSKYNEQCERLAINKNDPMCLDFV